MKLHLQVTDQGLPMGYVVTEASCHDRIAAESVMTQIPHPYNCFLQAKNAEKCKKKYIGLPAQDLRFQTGGRGRLDRGESVPQSIALSREGQDVGMVNQAIH
ncbi:hypothetical protein GCM10010965_31210 [Caldalkalibacillus thermarum]|nr:hypothetical protein GCM10010965_31210 [Caldalkalibacillus thermarum]